MKFFGTKKKSQGNSTTASTNSRMTTSDITRSNHSEFFVEEKRFRVSEELRSYVFWNDELITGDNEGGLRAWSFNNELKHHKGHSNIVRVLIVWGNFLVSGSYDRSIALWKTPFISENRIENAHNNWIYSFTIWKGNLVSGAVDEVKLWNETYQVQASIALNAFQVNVLNNEYIFVGGDHGMHLWKGDTNQSEQIRLPSASSSSIHTSTNFKNGFLFALYDHIFNIQFYDGIQNTTTQFDNNHDTAVWSLAFWNSSTIISGSQTTLMIHRADGTYIGQWSGHRDWIRHIFRWKGRLVSIGDDGTIAFWQVKNDWKVIRVLFIAIMKPQSSDCYLAKLPREIIRELQKILDPFFLE